MFKRIVGAVMVMASFVAMADKVVLKSGSFLTGEADIIADGVLKFNSDDLGSIDIKVANIASLESAKTHVVEYLDKSRETLPLTVTGGVYVVDGKPLDMSLVKAIDPGIETWHGSINVAYESDRGNTYKNQATILASLTRRWDVDRVAFNGGYYYTETGTSKHNREKTTDRWEIEGQHDHFWSNKIYSFENAKYEKDAIAGIDYRFRAGLGLGYQWLDGVTFESTGKWSFSQELGATWIDTSYADRPSGADDSYVTVRYAHHLKYFPKWNPGIEGFHNLEYLPQADDPENYLARADIGFTTKIILDFDLLAKIEWEYNSTPSEGRKSSDIRYILGLGYKW